MRLREVWVRLTLGTVGGLARMTGFSLFDEALGTTERPSSRGFGIRRDSAMLGGLAIVAVGGVLVCEALRRDPSRLRRR